MGIYLRLASVFLMGVPVISRLTVLEIMLAGEPSYVAHVHFEIGILVLKFKEAYNF